ncbi:MAG: flagellar basal body P-ring formation chaperone FlgA [Glaciecola sp.]
MKLTTKYTKVSAGACIVFTCFFNSFSSVHAQAPQNYQHISLANQVEQYISSNVNASANDDLRINVRPIDKRIEIPHCPSPFQFDANTTNPKQSNVSVKVTCPNTNWYLFTHATVALIQQVVVVKDSLSPGTLLSNSNTKLIEVDRNKLRGSAFSHKEDVVGARIKRRVRAGNIIDDRMLCFVCKGDRVTIAAVSGGLSIKVYGIAEEDGVLGDTIQVRNISSDRMVYAKIASTSEVQVAI